MDADMDHILNNIKQEPEVPFELILLKTEVEEPENTIKIEKNSEEFSTHQIQNQENIEINPEIDHIQNNIKQEPEVSFKLNSPKAEADELENAIGIEQNLVQISVNLRKFDEGRRILKKLFQTYGKCGKCDLMMPVMGLNRHCRNCTGNQRMNYSYFCKKCGKGFKTKRELVLHQKQNNRIFKCLFCDMKFEFKCSKHKHLKEVHEKDLKCPECQFVAKDYKKLHSHHNTAHKRFPCETCLKKFSAPSLLKNHQLQHKHGIYKNTSITFDCDQCTKSFSTNVYLKGHRGRVHGIKDSFQCDLCSKFFVPKTQLGRHMLTHIKVPCHICKKLVTRENFDTHLELHSKSSHTKFNLDLRKNKMNPVKNHILHIKQEPEASFKLVLPPAEVEDPLNMIKVEPSSEKLLFTKFIPKNIKMKTGMDQILNSIKQEPEVSL